MDVSVTFKEILREKRSLHALKTPKDEILPRAHQIKSPFLLEALAIAKGVRRMRRYLLDHAADYIDAHRHFAAKRARMTDRERDELDEELNVCMRECCKKIDHLKLELETRKDYQLLGENAREHLQGVVMDLYKRLEDLSRLHAQHKALRMQHQLEERRAYYHRVGPPTARAGLGRSGLTTRGAGVGLNHADDDDEKADAGIEDILRRGSATAKRRKAGGEGEREEDEGEEDDGGEGDEGELTASERATLRQENATMQRNFETTLDKTREIEQQVLEISHLQTLFADKVSQQKEAIEDIHKKAIESVDAVQRGNEYLQSATKSGRDFRVFILIFLLVCSFSLLFLHWYD